ncbi:MAG: YceI family protein [Gemmatimonadales bacterium]
MKPLVIAAMVAAATLVHAPAVELPLPPGPFRPAVNGLRLITADSGNEARYRVREQLANLDFPNDAVGVTSAVTGTLVIDSSGAILPAESKFTVDLTTLKSDKSRRDGYIQRRTLDTARYPSAEFVPARFEGYPARFVAGDSATFKLVGNLTIHGVTRETTWDVLARATPGGFAGSASTAFRFEDFGMEQPRVAIVLSVKDSIALEYDFNLVRP